MCLEERKYETSDETTQYASETVTALKSFTGEYRYLTSILTRVIFFVQVVTGVAAILSVFHVHASNGK